jgi:uncharacterized repeat protein (TIGR01451 family)
VLKFTDADTVLPGDMITYTVLIRNVGDAGTGWWAFSEADLVDQLPDGTSYVDGSLEFVDWPAGWMPPYCLTSDDTIACEFNVSPWGTTNEVRLRYAVQADPDLAMGTMLTNTVTVNDSYGILTVANSTVETLPPYEIFMPLVMKD